jgi:predicted glycoside hydrolase/deacetylase ChbG (UPF0249 family)
MVHDYHPDQEPKLKYSGCFLALNSPSNRLIPLSSKSIYALLIIRKYVLTSGGLILAKYLILNADDFGLSPSINRGILEAHLFGTVSSTTLMCNMPGFEDAVALAKNTPTLGVGLHFNLTYGKPLSNRLNVPSLINSNGYFSKNSRKWSAEHIFKELEAQFKRFLAADLYPTHLDSHHHIHIDSPLVYNAMKRLAIREQIPLRLNPQIQEQNSSFRCTNYLILDTYDAEDGITRLLGYLQTLPDGITELMCHPGYVDDVVRTYSIWTKGRELELNVFKDRRVVDKLFELDIQLVNFRFVPDTQASVSPNPEPEPIPILVQKHIRKTKKKKLLIRRKTNRSLTRLKESSKLKIKPLVKKKKRSPKKTELQIKTRKKSRNVPSVL